jgi:hypothetical protein
LATVLLFAYWVTEKLPRRAALTSIVIAMVYPYSLYISGAMYAESTFLFGAIAAFLAVDRRNYWLAGLAGMIATAARPLGAAVVVGLVIRVLEQLAQDRSGRVPTPIHQGRSVSVVRPRFVRAHSRDPDCTVAELPGAALRARPHRLVPVPLA